MDVALERQGPVLGWPLANVVEPVRELFGRDPVRVVEHHVEPDVDPPRVVLLPAGGAPDGSVVLVHRRSDGDRGRETHPAGHVIEETVARPHRLDAAAVAALQALDGEAVLARLAEVVRRADDHPVLSRPPTLGPPRPSLAPAATGPRRCLGWLRVWLRRRRLQRWFLVLLVCHAANCR